MTRPAVVAAVVAACGALGPAACSSDATTYGDGGIVLSSGSKVMVVEPDGTPIAEREFDADVRVVRVSPGTGIMLVRVEGNPSPRAFTIDARLRDPVEVGEFRSPSSWFRWRTLAADSAGWLFEDHDGYVLFDEVDGTVSVNPISSIWLGQRTVDGSWIVGDDLREPDVVEIIAPTTGDAAEVDIEWGSAEWASAVTDVAASRFEPLLEPGQRFALPVRRSDGSLSMVVRGVDPALDQIVTLDVVGDEVGRVRAGPVRHLGAHVAIIDAGGGRYPIIDPVSGDRLMTYGEGFFQVVDEIGERLLLLDGVLVDAERGLVHVLEWPEIVVDASPDGDRLLVLSMADDERRVMIAPVHAPEQAEFVVDGEPVAWLDPDVFDR